MARNSKGLTSEEAKAIDRKARSVFGISTLLLMENAGRAVAEEAIKMLSGKSAVAIFCGKGNNGADGFVAARHLLTRGIHPDIFLAGNISDLINEARTNLETLLRLKQRVREVKEDDLSLISRTMPKYSLIIDALLGVGLNGEVRGIYRDLIKLINAAGTHILSIDIPSGLDGTTGKILGDCIRADRTVTFVEKKRGMVLRQGKSCCGEVLVRDLGIPLGGLWYKRSRR